jgi:hypothetical protein
MNGQDHEPLELDVEVVDGTLRPRNAAARLADGAHFRARLVSVPAEPPASTGGRPQSTGRLTHCRSRACAGR